MKFRKETKIHYNYALDVTKYEKNNAKFSNFTKKKCYYNIVIQCGVYEKFITKNKKNYILNTKVHHREIKLFLKIV